MEAISSLQEPETKENKIKLNLEDLKEMLVLTFFGGIGGFFSWLYAVAIGEQNQMVWWENIPVSMLLGMFASFVGIYVIANTDTRAVKRALGYCVYSSWSFRLRWAGPYCDKAIPYIIKKLL